MRSFVIRLFILLGLFFTVGNVHAADTWATKAPMLTQRFNAAAAVVNGKLYVVGGKNAAGAAMATTEEYDPATNTWTAKAPMPTARWNFALVEVNGKLYAIGGKSGGATAAVAGMNNNEEYDPVSNTWAVKAPMPTGRNGRGAGVINGKIYVVGGRIGPNSAPVYTPINEEYDPATNTWTTKASMSAWRSGHAVAVANNKLYAVGGWNSAAQSNQNEEYDPSTDTWATKAPLLAPREDLAAAVVNNKLYAIGGFFDNGGGGLVETNNNEEYDPATDSWLARSPMPTARGTVAAAVVNNLVYAVGGSNGVYQSTGGAGSILFSTNEEYAPPTSGAATPNNAAIQAGLTAWQNLFATSIPAATDPTLIGIFDLGFFSDGKDRSAFIAMLTDPVNGIGVGFSFTNFAEITAPAGAVGNDATHQWFTFMPVVNNILQPPEVWLAIQDGAGNWLYGGNLRQSGVYWGTGSNWSVNPAYHWLNILIDDPDSTIQSAVLSGGSGLGTGALSSINNSAGGGKRWSGFFDETNASAGTFNYNAFPVLPVTYTLTVTKTDNTVSTRQLTYSGFNTNVVSNVAPTGNYTGATAPTFSWTAPPGGNYKYVFELVGIPRTPTSFYWSNNNLGGATSASYTGTSPLPPCSRISVFAEDFNGNSSVVDAYLGNNLSAGQTCGPNGITNTTIQAGLTALQNLFATSIPAETDSTLIGIFDLGFFSNGKDRSAFIAMLTDPVNGPGVGFSFTNFAEIAAPAGTVANDATHQWFTFTPVVHNTPQNPEVWMAIQDGVGNWLYVGNLQKYGVYWGTGSNWSVNPAYHWLNISIDDPNSTIQSAVLSGGAGLGSGVLSSINNPAGGKRWSSFFDETNTSAGTFNYNPFPALPVTYTLTITDTDNTVSTKQVTYNGFNTNVVSDINPKGNYTGTTAPIFTWTAPPGGPYNYVIELAELPRTATSLFWMNNNLGGATSATYTGPMPLPPCSAITVFTEDINGNGSSKGVLLGNNLPAGQVCGSNGVTAATSPNGVLSLTATSASVNETGPTVTLTVQRTGGSTGIITLPWSTSDGSAIAGTDFGTFGSTVQKTGTLTWLAGVTTPKTITIGLATANIPVINNTAVDGSRTFTVNLGTPTGSAVLGANTSATVTINDNDSTVAMLNPTATVAENGGNLILTVIRTGSIGTAASTTWSTVNGTALAGTHFGAAASLVQKTGTLSWAAGDGAAKTITIPILNVPAAQGDKTFTVNLVTATGATLSSSKSATITITDQTRNLALAATAVPVNEGAGNATLTVNRSGIASGAVSVNYTTANGTATAGQDYTAATGTLTWADGDTTPKTISVPITGDTLVEPAETLTVTLSAPTGGATITGLASATVTIADNDSNLQFGVPAASVSEKLAGILLTVTRTGSTSAPATVDWTATDGSATAGVDYGTLGNATPPFGTLTFAAGVASQTLSIPILADTLFEGNETFTVALSGPTNATIGANPQATVTLLDDEGGIQFEAANYTVVEGTPNVVIKVLRIGPAATAAQTVKWTAANVEAIAGADYGAVGNATLPSGTLTWAAGITTPQTITIPVTNDLAPEGDETFTVNLSNLTGGLAFSTAATATTVTIWDNDSTPESTIEFFQAKYHLEEVQGNAVLTVTRNGDTHRPASVNWTASNGTAIAGSDYGTKGNVALPRGTLSWAAADGAPKTISIPIIDDTTAEVMENFKITLSGNSVSTVLGTLGKATVVIKDIDEVFPPTGNLPLLWTLPNPVVGWHVAEDMAAAEGKYVVRTDTVFDNEAAQLQVAGNFLEGNASFKLKVSSEEGFDYLRFYIDGVKKGEWSGNLATNWTTTPNYPITAGPHVLLWSYEKDANTGLGQDAAWVDSVVMPAVTPLAPPPP